MTAAAYTVVYPVVRGTGPLFTVVGRGAGLRRALSRPVQWAGVALLSAGILGLSAGNLRACRVGPRDAACRRSGWRWRPGRAGGGLHDL